MITVIGLGVKKGDVSCRAAERLKAAEKVFVRTERTDSAQILKEWNVAYVSFDALFDTAETFEALYEKIAAELQKEQNAIYCVDGSGYEDESVRYLATKTETEILAGVSRNAQSLRFFPEENYITYAATSFCREKYAPTHLPLLLNELDSALLAGEVKLKLAELYGDEYPVYLFDQNGWRQIPLYELDRQATYGEFVSLLCLPKPLQEKSRFGIADLLEILDVLRSENGCPWDRAQTHETLRESTVEEAYELVDAVNQKDVAGMLEETGDLLMQPLFHVKVAESDGEFTLNDCLTGVCRKLLDRHTHVFGGDCAKDAATALDVWEKNKNIEKGTETGTDRLNAVPKSFPSLLRAYKLQKRAAKAGMDFETAEQVRQKCKEEWSEFEQACRFANSATPEEEGGDLLFSVVNLLRWADLSPELALNNANEKFLRRFAETERLAQKQGKTLNEMTPAEKDVLWEEAKKKV
mgnify:CR=1 FL=1